MTHPREVTTRTARIWIDDDEIIHYGRLPGLTTATTKADAEEAMAATWKLTGHRRLPVLADVRTVKSVERAARLHLTGPEAARLNVAVALLVGSPLSRAIGNFFLGLNKPLIPCRMFTGEPEALTWLRTFRE
ncbi:MAG: STAS/SEC14 domain-containing protein [Minicystis sp.]